MRRLRRRQTRPEVITSRIITTGFSTLDLLYLTTLIWSYLARHAVREWRIDLHDSFSSI